MVAQVFQKLIIGALGIGGVAVAIRLQRMLFEDFFIVLPSGGRVGHTDRPWRVLFENLAIVAGGGLFMGVESVWFAGGSSGGPSREKGYDLDDIQVAHIDRVTKGNNKFGKMNKS